MVQQRPVAHPVHQLVAIGRVQHLPKGVLAAQRAVPQCHREQVQVVVAEHARGAAAELHHAAQDAQGVRAAIHQVADEPEPVT